MKPPQELDGRPVLAFAEVPPCLKDEYEMTIVATGDVVLIAAYAIVKDEGSDGVLAIELDPAMNPLEDWRFESVGEAIGHYSELGLETVIC